MSSQPPRSGGSPGEPRFSRWGAVPSEERRLLQPDAAFGSEAAPRPDPPDPPAPSPPPRGRLPCPGPRRDSAFCYFRGADIN